MSTLDYQRWQLGEKRKRWDELRKIVSQPWSGDRGWEGRTIGLHLPAEIRNAAVSVQEKLQLRSMKEVLFKALIVGLKALNDLPPVAAPEPEPRPMRVVHPIPSTPTRRGRPLDIEEGIIEETDMEDFSGEEVEETPDETAGIMQGDEGEPPSEPPPA